MGCFRFFKLSIDGIKRYVRGINYDPDWKPSDEEIKKVLSYKEFFIAFFFSYIPAAIVVSLTWQSLLKFANPVDLSLAGFLLAVCIISIYRGVVVIEVSPFVNRRIQSCLTIFFLVLFVGYTVYVVVDASAASVSHDHYCKNLQTLIERGVDSEKNSSVFSNMQCRIQKGFW